SAFVSPPTTPPLRPGPPVFAPAPAPPELATLSLHDALPILQRRLVHIVLAHHRLQARQHPRGQHRIVDRGRAAFFLEDVGHRPRSEEHTSELQSRENLVCHLLLEKKKVSPVQACLGGLSAGW